MHDRQNWLFIGTQLAGARDAVVVSLLQSAKLNGARALGVTEGRADPAAHAVEHPD